MQDLPSAAIIASTEQVECLRTILWIKSLCAVLLGFGFYYSLMPYLPPAARHQAMKLDLGILVAGWSCLCMYGMIEMGVLLSRWLRSRSD